MRRGLLLGVDIGTTRIKVVAVDAAGIEQATASVATPFSASAHGVDMEVADLERALAEVVAAIGPARSQVTAVGVAGMAESGAPLRAGRPVGPVIAWHDGRGEETVASLDARFGPALPRWTGRRVRTVSSLAKLGWLIDQGITAPDRWLGVPELALFLFTGAEATEHSLAARTGAYHVSEGRFLPEVTAHVLAESGSDPDRLFPAVRAAGAAMGFVSVEAAARYGVPAGIPVTIAGHDHLAAAAGLGGGPDDLFNSVGTAETLLRRVGTFPDVERALELDLAVTIWPGGDAWGVLASATRSGLVVEALTAHLRSDPTHLDALAERSMETVTNHPAGDPVALGQGIEVPAGPAAEMWTATLGALARRTAVAAERVVALTGPHTRLVVFGGGSRSTAWLGAKAAEVGVPVVACSVPEAAARGAALAAGVAAGWWPSVATGPTPDLTLAASGPWREQWAPDMTETTPGRPIEPEMSPEVAERSGLRTGWTTGTCASAAAKAAAIGLCSGTRPETVEVGLPDGQRVTFPVEPGPSGEPFEAVVVKDAGDDPDCTDGARMTATVAFAGDDGPEEHELRAGDGIGTVTLPGLGLPVGTPAINPVPRT
ncbi:MAG: cobalt-precorrin-5B (C(1))-methyltransferase, partial [Acidimicrobiia bacterium]